MVERLDVAGGHGGVAAKHAGDAGGAEGGEEPGGGAVLLGGGFGEQGREGGSVQAELVGGRRERKSVDRFI